MTDEPYRPTTPMERLGWAFDDLAAAAKKATAALIDYKNRKEAHD